MNNLNSKKFITEKIGIASDHAGFQLKNLTINFLNGHMTVIDYGTDSENSVDYPDYAKKLSDAFKVKSVTFGILICGSGIGMSIYANRTPCIRAALCHNKTYAKLAREHNDANVLVLGARFLNFTEAKDIINTFL